MEEVTNNFGVHIRTNITTFLSNHASQNIKRTWLFYTNTVNVNIQYYILWRVDLQNQLFPILLKNGFIGLNVSQVTVCNDMLYKTGVFKHLYLRNFQEFLLWILTINNAHHTQAAIAINFLKSRNNWLWKWTLHQPHSMTRSILWVRQNSRLIEKWIDHTTPSNSSAISIEL